MPKKKVAAVSTLPLCPDALNQLFRRQVRALTALVLRIFLLAIFMVLLYQQWPALRSYRWLVETVSGLICVGPLLTAVGRNWKWRIALGRAYLAAGQYADAERVLRPLQGLQGPLFDMTGEGTLALREAQEHLKS